MKSSHLHLPALVSALLIATSSHGLAEVTAQGTIEIAHVEVKNSSLDEVLKALHDAYGLTYRSEVSLDTRISGAYEGSLPQVLSRLLDGTNYVLTKNGSNFRVVIVAGPRLSPIQPTAAMPNPEPGGQLGASPQLPAGMFPAPGPLAPSARDK